MDFEQQTLHTMRELQSAYWEKRDREQVAALLDPSIVWIETGKTEIVTGLSNVQHMLEKEMAAFPMSFAILSSQYHSQFIQDGICSIYGTLEVRRLDGDVSFPAVFLPVSANLHHLDGRWKICQIHMSSFLLFHQQGEGLSADRLQVNNQILYSQLDERNRDLRELMNNIPGGVFHCAFDEKVTLLQMSDSFFSMFGYTREEIRDQFDDSFLAMIYPEDRQLCLDEVHRQLQNGNMAKELEYRILCKDGSVIWVMDKGQLIRDEDGKESFYCVLIDMTRKRKAEENLRLSVERHQIIMDQTTDIIFEWDIEADTISYSGNWKKQFGYAPITAQVREQIPTSSHIHPDDMPAFSKILVDVQDCVPYSETEFRIRNAQGVYIWCRIRATAQFNDAGKPVKVVGIILNIDEEKREAQKLLEKAEQDALTGLYNKITAQSMVDTCLDASPSQMLHALLIIDIDNFKEINDTWGHLFGDKVLVGISSQMKKLFRSSDILGRIGGDEFIVLLKNVPSREFAMGKAKQLREMFLPDSKEEENSYHISGSIGISFYPQDGESFEQLYHKADVALYYAKAKGKNCCEAYTGDMECGSFFQSKVLTPIEETDGGKKLEKNQQLVESIFYVMCKSLDIYTAVSSILEMVGKQFDVSRVYIFEEIQESMKIQNTFEWCNDGIEPQIQKLQHLSLQDWGDYYNNFDENGIFNCRDIQVLPERERALLEGQGIKSLVQYAILDRGKIRGFVGFDECRMQRFWTQEQVNALHLISEILSAFLLKQREWEQMEIRANQMQSLLDHQNAWVYAIEQKSFRLQFVNKKTKDSFPNVKNGMRCYEALWGKKQPCDHCPVQNSSGLVELCRGTSDRYLRMEVSPLPWKGKKVSLVTCYDLTDLLEEKIQSSL